VPPIRSDFVEVIVFRRRGRQTEYLLLRRSGSERPYPGIWQVVSGRRRSRERASTAAIREVREESGHSPLRVWSLPFVNTIYVSSLDQVQCMPTFAAELPSDAAVRLSSEHSEGRWVSMTAARRLVLWQAHVTLISLVKDVIIPGRGWSRHTQID